MYYLSIKNTCLKNLSFYEVFPKVPLYNLMNKVSVLVGGFFLSQGIVMGSKSKTLSGALLCVVGGINMYVGREFNKLTIAVENLLNRKAEAESKIEKIRENYLPLQEKSEQLKKQMESCDNQEEKKALRKELIRVREDIIKVFSGDSTAQNIL